MLLWPGGHLVRPGRARARAAPPGLLGHRGVALPGSRPCGPWGRAGGTGGGRAMSPSPVLVPHSPMVPLGTAKLGVALGGDSRVKHTHRRLARLPSLNVSVSGGGAGLSRCPPLSPAAHTFPAPQEATVASGAEPAGAGDTGCDTTRLPPAVPGPSPARQPRALGGLGVCPGLRAAEGRGGAGPGRGQPVQGPGTPTGPSLCPRA